MVHHDLHVIGVGNQFRLFEFLYHRGQVDQLGVRAGEDFDEFFQRLAGDEGFVALDIDHDVAVDAFDDFRDAVGAGFMVFVAAEHLSAVGLDGLFDTVVVGYYIYLVEKSGGNGRVVSAGDDRFAAQVGQHFALEARRIVSRRDHGDGFHKVFFLFA